MNLRSTFFALCYDRMMARVERAGLHRKRQDLLGEASGRVLEIGAGTGANLPLYGAQIASLTVTEPEAHMMRRLVRKARDQVRATTVVQAPAEDLPFRDGTFDTAVATLVLCSVDDQRRAVTELRRVLRPGGSLLFFEHVRSGDPRTARLQDRLNWLNRFTVCCECNRQTLRTIQDAGFTVTRVEETELPRAPRMVRPAVMGVAVVPGPGAAGGSEATPEERSAVPATART
jgi:ubiquinone/menaquinone biosynthesis C-methylase UbiE